MSSGTFSIRWYAATLLCSLLLSVATRAGEPPPVPDELSGSANSAGAEAEGLLADASDIAALADMDLEELAQQDALVPSLDQPVTTVERHASTVRRTPAAIHVITSEMIRHSPFRRLPDLLRMVPGLIVQRPNSSLWHVGIRGGATRFSPRLLFQIDGRSVYTPLFSGVYWDVQDLLLEDIDRIEVIRGPGASVWGSNAVDGIINIVTKSARDTQGVLWQAGFGTEERAFTALRYGTTLGENAWLRVYTKAFDRDAGFSPIGQEHDDWRQMRGGFRADWEPDDLTTVTVQGDLYQGITGFSDVLPALVPGWFIARRIEDVEVHGGNLLARWSSGDPDIGKHTIQVYYDAADRHRPLYRYERQTIDLDWQYELLVDDHRLVLGGGYRSTWDEFEGDGFVFALHDPDRQYSLANLFVQDSWQLLPDLLTLTSGVKLEMNDFSGLEVQPTVRMLWTPREDLVFWGAVSRAVRTPSRADDGLIAHALPVAISPAVFPLVLGTPDFDSEELLAYEAGARTEVNELLYLDVTVYYHNYDRLRGGVELPLVPRPYGFDIPTVLVNSVRGEAYGVELATSYQLSTTASLYAAYTFARTDARSGPRNVLGQREIEDTVPRNQLFAQLNWQPLECLSLGITGRYVDRVAFWRVPPYFVMDLMVTWNPVPDVDVIVAATDLLDRTHPEAGRALVLPSDPTEVERAVYLMFRWEPGRAARTGRDRSR